MRKKIRTYKEVSLEDLDVADPDRTYVRRSDFARLVGVSYSTVVRWIKQGKLSYKRTHTGMYLIPLSELRNFLDGNASADYEWGYTLSKKSKGGQSHSKSD